MKKKYQYRNLTTDEVVEDFISEEYALNELGIKVEPRRKKWRNDNATT